LLPAAGVAAGDDGGLPAAGRAGALWPGIAWANVVPSPTDATAAAPAMPSVMARVRPISAPRCAADPCVTPRRVLAWP
jgi:hypothetical protein